VRALGLELEGDAVGEAGDERAVDRVGRRLRAVARADMRRPQPSRAASTSARASRGCAGTRAIARPVSVSPPLPIAPSAASVRVASSMRPMSGGSSQGNRAKSATPSDIVSSIALARSMRSTSGAVCASRRSCSASDQRRIARPGAVRPARPARCSALAFETGSTRSVSSPRSGS